MQAKNSLSKIFKVYDPAMKDEERNDYWEKKMENIYFQNPDYFLSLIKRSGIYSFLDRYLPKNGLILDGGCGSNYLSHLLDDDSRRVVGLDFAVASLIQGKKIYPEAMSVAGDLNDLPFKDRCFDCVISVSTAEHLECGPHKLLEETKRVLKDDGTFLLIIPTYTVEDRMRDICFRLFTPSKDGLYPTPHFSGPKECKSVDRMEVEDRKGFFAYWIGKGELKRLLKAAGFEVISASSLDILGGLARSKIFSKRATEYIKKVFTSQDDDNLNWTRRIFVREEIFDSRFNYVVHELLGFFYRYLLAFVCKPRD